MQCPLPGVFLHFVFFFVFFPRGRCLFCTAFCVHFLGDSSERHLFVLENKGKCKVKTMCCVLKISKSGYYRRLKNRNKPTARELLSVEIKAILDEHP